MYRNKVYSVPNRIVYISQPWIRHCIFKSKGVCGFGAKLDVSIDSEGYGRLYDCIGRVVLVTNRAISRTEPLSKSGISKKSHLKSKECLTTSTLGFTVAYQSEVEHSAVNRVVVGSSPTRGVM